MRDSFEAQNVRPGAKGVPVIDIETAEPIEPANRAAVMGWAFVGFVIGAVFWHFIGFWSFVSDTVLRGPASATRVIAQTGQDCSEFALDRATGQIKLLPCPLHAPQMADISVSVRSDSERHSRLKKLDTSRWTIQISQDTDDEQFESR